MCIIHTLHFIFDIILWAVFQAKSCLGFRARSNMENLSNDFMIFPVIEMPEEKCLARERESNSHRYYRFRRWHCEILDEADVRRNNLQMRQAEQIVNVFEEETEEETEKSLTNLWRIHAEWVKNKTAKEDDWKGELVYIFERLYEMVI